MTDTGVHNKPPIAWSNIQSSNGIVRNLNIHPATSQLPRISQKHNIVKLVRAATKNIPGAAREIDRHFSEDTYSSYQHVVATRSTYEHLHDHPH